MIDRLMQLRIQGFETAARSTNLTFARSARGATFVAAMAAALIVGCQNTNTQPTLPSASRNTMNDENLSYAISVLHTMDELHADDALNTVVGRLQEWRKHKQPIEGWKVDPLVETLPESLRELPDVTSLEEVRFLPTDGLDLQQTVWLNEIARRVRGEESNPVQVASSLFDWVIRNIQLERDGTIEVPHLARDTLFFGRGTAADRAWVFALLARQQELDVVMLAFPGSDADAPPRLWLPALAVDGELYLFDVRLGLPIPGPEGKPVATLNDVLKDESLLRQLDVDKAQRAYPVRAADLDKLVVLIEASPIYLSQRMRLVETELPGKETLVLTTDASAIADRVRTHPHVERVQLWALPYERLEARRHLDNDMRMKAMVELGPFEYPTRSLWKARVLHLLGEYAGKKGASALYQESRQPDEELQRHVKMAPPQHAQQAAFDVGVMRGAKQAASYWLGLMAFDRANYPAAIDYLDARTLKATPDGPWTGGARYNLGRTYEALGQIDDAVRYYQADLSAQRNGNLLRARRLEEQSKKAAGKDSKSATETPDKSPAKSSGKAAAKSSSKPVVKPAPKAGTKSGR